MVVCGADQLAVLEVTFKKTQFSLNFLCSLKMSSLVVKVEFLSARELLLLDEESNLSVLDLGKLGYLCDEV